MIAQTATAAAGSSAGIAEKISAFVAQARASAADGLTWSEFGQLMIALLRITMAAIDDYSMLSGAEKKAMVLEGVAMLFDAVADKAVPLAAWPVWVLIRPAVRSLVLAIASGAVEQMLPMIRGAK